MEVTFPRIVLAEFNTHRVFSRNSASSRAIPVEKILKRVAEDPFVPDYWGKNQKGMQADQELNAEEQHDAAFAWNCAKERAADWSKTLLDLGVHKQITNRLLEPFLWHTVIVTATEWENFFALRAHPSAQPEIRKIAELMRAAQAKSNPTPLGYGEWHRPLIDPETWEKYRNTRQGDDWLFWNKVSAARCARVSYLTHDGVRDVNADVQLHDRLAASGHMSPFEHVARPLLPQELSLYRRGMDGQSIPFCGNFKGWLQYRKTFKNEAVWSPAVEE
jgi:thymidylate synthase ThyX